MNVFNGLWTLLQEFKTEEAVKDRSPWRMTISLLLAAVFLYLIQDKIGEKFPSFASDGSGMLCLSIARELAMALLIAACLNISIEHTNRKNHEEIIERINREVHSAVLKRSLPREIFDECDRSIFRSDVFRHTQRVWYSLEKFKKSSDAVLLKGEWSFWLSNPGTKDVTHKVTLGAYDNPKFPNECAIEKISINEIELSSEEVRKGLKKTGSGIMFEKEVTVAPRRDVVVKMQYKQVHSGHQSFEAVVSILPSMDLHVEVYVPEEDFIVECQSMHPLNPEIDREHDGNRHYAWKLPGASLPGQGILLFWNSKLNEIPVIENSP